MRRYLPKTQRLTILEFGNKFFTKNGKILKPDEKFVFSLYRKFKLYPNPMSVVL